MDVFRYRDTVSERRDTLLGGTSDLSERRKTLLGGRSDLFRSRDTLSERRDTLSVRRNTLGGSCETLFGCREDVCVRRGRWWRNVMKVGRGPPYATNPLPVADVASWGGLKPATSPLHLPLSHLVQRRRLHRPIQGIDTRGDASPKRGVRPIDRTRGIAMLHGIDVYVVDHAAAIVVVTHQVLPIASLPDAPLPAGDALRGSPLVDGQSATEDGFDMRPSGRA